MKRILFIVFVSLLLILTACEKRLPPSMHSGASESTTTMLQSSHTHPTLSTSGHMTIPTTFPTTPTITAPSSVPPVPEPEYLVVSYDLLNQNGGVTYTGLPILPATKYLLADPMNIRQLSTERIDHAFGAAADGKPHRITVENQQRFDVWGTDGLAWDSITKEKVLYLTFDCGYEYGNITSQILDILKEKQVQTTFFCTMTYLRTAPEVIARMIAEGHNVGNHSLSHPADCAALTREEMVVEALAVENYLRVYFGYSGKYFRFPSGIYSENAMEALHSVGYRSVFWSIAYADWDPENQIGEDAAYQTLTQRLHPGAVILLHTTSPDNAAILADFIDECLAQGYRFCSLDDYPGWN